MTTPYLLETFKKRGWTAQIQLAQARVIHSFTHMIKKLSKIGNSRGIIFDAAIMEQAHLKEGDAVNVTVHEGGSITLTPIRRTVSTEEIVKVADEIMDKNKELFRRLA